MKHLLSVFLVLFCCYHLTVAQQNAPVPVGKSDAMVPDYKKPAPKKGQVNATAKPTKATPATPAKPAPKTTTAGTQNPPPKTRGGAMVHGTTPATPAKPSPKPQKGQVNVGGNKATTTKGGTPQNLNSPKGSDPMVPNIKPAKSGKPTPKANAHTPTLTPQTPKNATTTVVDRDKKDDKYPMGGIKPAKGSNQIVPNYKDKSIPKPKTPPTAPAAKPQK